METNHLQKLTQIHGASGDEDLVREYLLKYFERKSYNIQTDNLGSIIVSNNDNRKSVSVVAHMDEVGMIVSYIDECGLIYFNPIGSWFDQSMLNHRVEIKTNNGDYKLGIIGSASPHALPKDMKKIEIDQMFIDIGADSKKQVIDAGITIGCFICPVGQYSDLGTKVIAKAFDNRAGCALLLDIEKEVINDDIKINYIGTVQEEVGLRGAQTSSTVVKTDIALILDVVICGDTPNVDSRKFQTNMNDGPSICLFDMRTIPNKKLVNYVKQVATDNNINFQHYTLQTGATDGGRYNVMAGGSAVISIGLPTRYLHANNSMISKADYNQTKQLIIKILNDLTPEKISNITTFIKTS